MTRDKMVEEFTAADGAKSYRCVWRYAGKLQRTKRMSGPDAERYTDSLAAAIRYLNKEIAADDARITSGVLVHHGVNAEAPGSRKPENLGYWLDAWLNARLDVANATVTKYAQSVALLAPFSSWLVTGWTPEHSRRIQVALRETHGARTINVAMERVNGALNLARANGVAAPVMPKGAVKRLRAKKRGIVLTMPQARSLLARITDERAHDAALLSLNTGMRLGEIAALTGAAIRDPETPGGVATIVVSQSAAQDSREVGRTKAENSEREIDIDPATYAMLMRRRAVRSIDEYLFAREGEYSRSPYVGAITDRYREARNAMVADGELPAKYATLKDGLRFHDLRHTHGSVCLKAGMPIYAVAERMGHTVKQLTEIYAHTDSDVRSALAGVMAAALAAAPADELAARRIG